MIVTDKVNILTAAPSAEESRERPFVFGAQELIPAGFHLLDTRRPDEALLVFRLSVDEYPENPNALGGLGESFLRLGDTTSSTTLIDEL